MSHAMTASPKPSSGAPWRVGSAVVSRGNSGGQHQRVEILAHSRTAHKGLLQKRLEEGSQLNRPSCPPDDLIGQETELNRLWK